MDDSNVTLNLEMSIFFSNLNQVKIVHEEGEPAAAIEVVELVLELAAWEQ